MGAEDYIVKPFEIVELLARVDVVLRRYRLSEEEIHICGLDIDTRSMRVTRRDRRLPLPERSYELLLFFARNPNTALYPGGPSMRECGAGNLNTEARRWTCMSRGLRKKK